MKTHRIIPGLLGWLAMLLSATASRGADNGAFFHPVDLTPYYNQLPNSFSPGSCWTKVPMGPQVFAGVPFELGGVMELTGLGAARNSFIFPGRHTDIPVGCPAGWIHLILGAGYSAEEGTVIAFVRLRYEGGLRREIPLSYGVHTKNWWVEDSEPDNHLSGLNTQVAWTGFSKESRPEGVKLRLFKASFPNPEPNRKIETMELASAFSTATPVVVGVTVGDAGQGVKTPGADAKPYAREPAKAVVIKVRDQATDHALAGARLQLGILCDKRTFAYGEQVADANGSARVDCPDSDVKLVIAASAPGMAQRQRVVELNQASQEVTLKLEPGKTIGGVVRDAAGQPIAGARILISLTTKNERGQLVNTEAGPFTTGADGRWQCSSLMSDAADLSFEVTHPKYKPATVDEIAAGDPDEFSVLRADLNAAKAVFTLQPLGAVRFR